MVWSWPFRKLPFECKKKCQKLAFFFNCKNFHFFQKNHWNFVLNGKFVAIFWHSDGNLPKGQVWSGENTKMLIICCINIDTLYIFVDWIVQKSYPATRVFCVLSSLSSSFSQIFHLIFLWVDHPLVRFAVILKQKHKRHWQNIY